MMPSVSLLFCTVRPSHAYRDHPEWDCIGRVVEDLADQQGAPPFELVVVDGLFEERYNYGRHFDGMWARQDVDDEILHLPFSMCHAPPRSGSPWVRRRKVAISAYRNTGIAAARGELIINLDDCCRLPPNFVATFWRAWSEHRLCLAMTWPQRGDCRAAGRVNVTGMPVYGFGSYPRELALELNGYDEAYDGGQGLEDADWSTRLRQAGLHQALIHLPGFDIEPQTSHSPEAIDPVRPIVKCCNAAWQAQRVRRNVMEANRPELWDRESLRQLVGPCAHLHGEMCRHHGDRQRCAYLDKGLATALDPEAAIIFSDPPVIDLRQLSEEMR